MLVVIILVSSLTIAYIALSLWEGFKSFISASPVIGPLVSSLIQLEQPPHESHTAEL